MPASACTIPCGRWIPSSPGWIASSKHLTDELDEAAKQIPPEWYGFDMDALYALLDRLDRRRARVREQIEEARKSSRQPFLKLEVNHD